MRRFGCVILVVGVLAAISSPFIRAFRPSFEGWREMRSAIAAIEAFDVAAPIHSKRSYGVNTYTHECSSLSIKSYYHRAAGALAERSPDIRTYHWLDEMGWGRVSAVLQTPNGFVEVRASCNNDNDSVYVVFTPGHFEKPDAKIVESHELPNGFLRCDWER